MAFLALCCLKKCSGFEMSRSSSSEVPTSSPSNFLHLTETPVFSHMQFLQQKVCRSDLRGISAPLISPGDGNLLPETVSSLCCLTRKHAGSEIVIIGIFKPANHSHLGVILGYLKGRNICACLLYKQHNY